ncbi:hypothetical protein H4I96_11351 [Botrytis cinerea]
MTTNNSRFIGCPSIIISIISSGFTANNPIVLPVTSSDLGNTPPTKDGNPDQTLERAKKDREVGTSVQYIDFPRDIPDISFSKSETKNKSISASSKTFHASLADAILDGFVVLPASGYGALKNVFKALTKAVETRSQVSDEIKQCIILQRYEYSPVTGRMSSFIRISLFEVTSEMVEVQSSSTTVNVQIESREHEAEKEKLKDYVKDDTIEIPV